MPNIYNKKFILIPTYTPEDFLSEDGKRMDERPIMHIAIDIDWLRQRFYATVPTMRLLEPFIDEEATFDDFEDLAEQAIAKGLFAFAIYDDGEETKTLFPNINIVTSGNVACMMEAYREFMLEETVFDHICRVAKKIPYNARKGCPVGFVVDGGELVFGESDPTRYANKDGAETAFIDILRRCGEQVEKNPRTGALKQTIVLADA